MAEPVRRSSLEISPPRGAYPKLLVFGLPHGRSHSTRQGIVFVNRRRTQSLQLACPEDSPFPQLSGAQPGRHERLTGSLRTHSTPLNKHNETAKRTKPLNKHTTKPLNNDGSTMTQSSSSPLLGPRARTISLGCSLCVENRESRRRENLACKMFGRPPSTLSKC